MGRKKAKLGHDNGGDEIGGLGEASNKATGKQRASFHFFKDIPLDIFGEVSFPSLDEACTGCWYAANYLRCLSNRFSTISKPPTYYTWLGQTRL